MPRPGEPAREGSTTPSRPPRAAALSLQPFRIPGLTAQPQPPSPGMARGGLRSHGRHQTPPSPALSRARGSQSSTAKGAKGPNPRLSRTTRLHPWVYGRGFNLRYPWLRGIQSPQKSSSYLSWWSPEALAKEKSLLGAGRGFKGRASVLLSTASAGQEHACNPPAAGEQLSTAGRERGCKTGPQKCTVTPSPKGC